ncbi:autotransporter domain protein [Campylobacter avium]|uniref:autotransporter outer membrane beta-barrel domain-containing protein n=1 Tax=Campylobacter avium TaxID=522485 RepID=UPI000B9531BD|nr:autotransporter outer membrane beta-barrel domain-containing protein [Campylobacter avium]OYD79305.1 autotransporter domain protein [Campylobacter avium]
MTCKIKTLCALSACALFPTISAADTTIDVTGVNLPTNLVYNLNTNSIELGSSVDKTQNITINFTNAFQENFTAPLDFSAPVDLNTRFSIETTGGLILNNNSNYKVELSNTDFFTNDITATDIAFKFASNTSSVINSKVILQSTAGSKPSAADFDLNDKHNQFYVGKDASVTINGDFDFQNAALIFESDGSKNHSNFVINGDIGTGGIYTSSALFVMVATNYKALEFDRFVALTVNGTIDGSVDGGSQTTALLKQDYKEILSNSNINLGAFEAREQNLNNFVTYDVWAERPANGTGSSYGVMSGKLNDNARDINAVLNAKNTYLRSLYTQLEESRSTTDNAALKGNLGAAMQDIERQQAAITAYTNASTQAEKDAALKAYNALFIKDEQILELSTNLIDKNIANSGLKNYVIFEMLNSPSHKAEVASSINKSAKSIANSNSAISSQQQIINLANEAAINARMVYLKNPYKSDEEKMGNMAYDEAGRTYATFINNTDNGLWANFFGGKNILNSNSASVLGGSLGFDKRISDDSLLGLYLTYADVNLNDKIINEEGKSYQLGLYYNKNFANNMELDLKANFGFNPAKQNYMLGSYDTTSSFTRNYYTISASVGKVVDLADNGGTSIKHFIGVNYYNTYTPAYNTNSDFSLEHKSYAASAISFDLGIGLKQYFNENSFFPHAE